jgi:hypothetical protein
MRQVIPAQSRLGQSDISQIKISTRSRDDIPDILRGLQYIYVDDELQKQLFSLLTKLLDDKQRRLGRKGMDLWRIFVLATLRVNLNWDYDRLQTMANGYELIRQMLGHSIMDEDYQYPLQTLKDNVQLLTPEILDEINQAIVMSGHTLVKKGDENTLRARADSFVVETNVHFPTDIGLLYDALRKGVQLTRKVCDIEGISEWRQSNYNIRCIKQSCRKAQKSKRGGGKDKEARIAAAHQTYINLAKYYLEKLEATFQKIKSNILSVEIASFLKHAYRQIDQIERRILKGEIIPTSEKVYSLFESHTEWVNKGKAGGKIELGLKVCIVEDQHQFILHHCVMEKEVDSDIAENIVKASKKRFENLTACSFDKGFGSAANQAKLEKILSTVTMPNKGKLSKERYKHEHSPEFIKARHQHSAVESAINCLEQHGLDKCLDKGIVGFERYVAIAIVSRNIQRIGAILRAKDRSRENRRRRKLLKAA